ncbi:MAG TPA: YjbQ family protein [Anaerolineae bacterium]|nr:YjbQ family protein [Anaerolineae bacterium]
MFKEIDLKSEEQQTWINLTEEVRAIVEGSGVEEGICIIYNPHTTAGLFVNSYLDPNTPKDILHEWDRLIPTRYNFYHQFDTPTDAAGHVKSTLMGVEATLIIHEGKLMLGHSQGIIFAEFDGPRERKIYVKVISD